MGSRNFNIDDSVVNEFNDNKVGNKQSSMQKYLTGWFKFKHQDDVTLRISHNETKLPGSLRFNKYNSVFQGYNGYKWIDLNASKGDKGDIGQGFQGKLKLDKIGDGVSILPLGELNLSVEDDNVPLLKIKSIKGGTVEVNEKLDGSIELNSVPQPFEWNLHGKTIDELKGSSPQGNVSIYTIVEGECKIGEIACYKLLKDKQTFGIVSGKHCDNPLVCGVVIENAKEGESCKVCTHGIVLAKISGTIGNNNYHEPEIEFGNSGYLGSDGGVFNSYTKGNKIGRFMEEGEFRSGDMVLFFIGCN